MLQATDTLKKSRNINISISLDAEALMSALGKPDEEEETHEQEKATAASLLRQTRDEPKIVKLSQIPMAG